MDNINYLLSSILLHWPNFSLWSFLANWASHMYNKRLMYKNQFSSDYASFIQVLISIDRALKMYWKSCFDRESVKYKILLIQDTSSIQNLRKVKEPRIYFQENPMENTNQMEKSAFQRHNIWPLTHPACIYKVKKGKILQVVILQ